MDFSFPITQLVQHRHSCRSYSKEPVAQAVRQKLSQALAEIEIGPFGARGRFSLVAATEADSTALKGLGAYGAIRNPRGFIVGAMTRGRMDLEDFGYLMERAILHATDLGLSTCWLGGIFSKSNFARRISLSGDELLPAVASVGYPADGARDHESGLPRAKAHSRLVGESLFFEGSYGNPIGTGSLGSYAAVLEMVRHAPSANNKQPWRILRDQAGWHFFLERTKGYGKGTFLFSLFRIGDLQRADMGIAICHFDLAARELGLTGSWILGKPSVTVPESAEYVATWRPDAA